MSLTSAPRIAGVPYPGIVDCGAEGLATLIPKTGVGPPVPGFTDL